MSLRNQKIVLGVLLVILVVVYFWSTGGGNGVTGVAQSDLQFTPLNVQQPELRVDLLDKLHESSYGAGPHRNVFVFGAAPIVVSDSNPGKPQHKGPWYPDQPRKPVIPPLQVSAQFFGTATMPASGRHVAFFQSGEDVVIVAEGDAFLTRYRLIHIANESADVQEISSGRHAMVPLVPPVVDQAANQQPGQPQGDQPNQDVAQ
jgi:hypothetical protein